MGGIINAAMAERFRKSYYKDMMEMHRQKALELELGRSRNAYWGKTNVPKVGKISQIEHLPLSP